MEINSINNFSIGSLKSKSKETNEKENEKENELDLKNQDNQKETNPENLFNAMDILGKQMLAGINSKKSEQLNETKDLENLGNIEPKNYLSEDRIAEIEAMMGKFDSGVQSIAEAIGEEFPDIFSDEQKFALAADIYTR